MISLRNSNLKFIWRVKRTRISNIILKKKSVEGLTVFNFKTT